MKETKKTEKIDEEKVWSVVAYFFFILPLIFVKHRTKFLNFHINQAIILVIVSILGQIAVSIVDRVFWFFPGHIWNLLMFILVIIGIINAVNKKMEPLPVIGKYFTFLN